MVKVWDSAQGDDFTCENCGAEYATAVFRYPMRDSDSASCEVCKKVMAKWNSTSVPSFKLKKGPD